MGERAAPPRGQDAHAARGAVVTVGTFDGIHRGHQELIARLRDKAAKLHRPAALVTFEPHPLEIVRPAAAPPLLTTTAEKKEILAQSGVDHVVVLHFDQQLAGYEPRRFVEEILVRGLGLAHLVIGYDHGFGRDRSGDADTLKDIGRELGFDVDVVGPVMLNGEPVSSSRIRETLQRGDVRRAANALGRPYDLTGEVVPGEGRGRGLGFPTANLRLDPRKLVPLDGIYAVGGRTRGVELQGVLHIGPRPTFGDAVPTIELFAFDFDDDLYGEQVRVTFCERIRGVERFASEAALVHAMEADVSAARRVFADGGGACGSSTTPLQSMA